MRVLIPCAGKQARWPDCDTPKHLVKLCGEPILHRAVRLINERRPDAEIKIVVENPYDPRYVVPGAVRTAAKLDPELGDVDKFASSRHLWSEDDWTLILFGDVWWSTPAIDTVLGYVEPEITSTAEVLGEDGEVVESATFETTVRSGEWTAFARFGPAGAGGEIFGFAIHPHEHERFDAAIAEVAKYANAKKADGKGLFRGGVRGGWGLYRVLTGGDPLTHEDRGHYTPIDDDDFTNDMDTRRDWDRFCLRWAKADKATRSRMRD